MKSPDCKSCMHACKRACTKPCSTSPIMMGGQGNCKIIKRCTSPKPIPVPGCKWVKKCSPSLTDLGDGVISPTISPIITSPYYYGRRRYSPYFYGRRHHRRHYYSPHRRISPNVTTVIGRQQHRPFRRMSVSPHRGGVVSPIIRRR